MPLTRSTKQSACEVPAKLGRSTQIPTHARGKVRALVKAHKGFTAFLLEKDLISAQAKNKDLIEFALRHSDLTAQIEAILMPIRPALLATNAVPAPESTVYVIERLLREFYKRQRVAHDEAALGDFNYVGSRHHY